MLSAIRSSALLVSVLLATSPALAQMPGGGPPAVGTTLAGLQAIAETTEINGRIQAVGRVDLTARVTAYLQEQLFVEGAEVKKGDLLFRLERPPFEADAEAKRAAVAQAEAQLDYADLALGRAEQLLKTNAGSQSTADNARSAQKSAAAQLRLAKAQLRQSEINLGYTEIRAPIDGRIGRIQVTPGNVVGPSSGALATVVSLDPDLRGVSDLGEAAAAAARAVRSARRLRGDAHPSAIARRPALRRGRQAAIRRHQRRARHRHHRAARRDRQSKTRRRRPRTHQRRNRPRGAGKRQAARGAGDPARRGAERSAGRLRLCGERQGHRPAAPRQARAIHRRHRRGDRRLEGGRARHRRRPAAGAPERAGVAGADRRGRRCRQRRGKP